VFKKVPLAVDLAKMPPAQMADNEGRVEKAGQVRRGLQNIFKLRNVSASAQADLMQCVGLMESKSAPECDWNIAMTPPRRSADHVVNAIPPEPQDTSDESGPEDDGGVPTDADSEGLLRPEDMKADQLRLAIYLKNPDDPEDKQWSWSLVRSTPSATHPPPAFAVNAPRRLRSEPFRNTDDNVWCVQVSWLEPMKGPLTVGSRFMANVHTVSRKTWETMWCAVPLIYTKCWLTLV